MSTAASIHAARAPLAAHAELLRGRAAALARVPVREERADSVPAVLFQLGAERYAVAAARVLEVTALRELTPLPGAPPPLLGITHWRGDVLTVLDLRDVLGVQTHGITDLRRLIVIDARRRPFGILADQAHTIVPIDTRRLRRTPEPDEENGLIAGVTDDAVLMIDADALVRAHTGENENNPG